MTIPTRAGRLRHLLTFQAPTVVRDGTGDEVVTYSTFKAARGSVEPLKGEELFLAQRVNPRVSHKVTTRWVVGVTPRMRIVYGSRTFEVESALSTDERRRDLTIICWEVAPL